MGADLITVITCQNRMRETLWVGLIITHSNFSSFDASYIDPRLLIIIIFFLNR